MVLVETSDQAEVRILIADDHPIFRAGLRERLGAGHPHLKVVAEVADGQSACDFIRIEPVDVVLMDISMPRLNGIEATRAIRRESPGTAVVILSVYDDEQYVHAALDAGAVGYLLKTVEVQELSDAIARVRAGEVALSPAVVRKVMTRMTYGSQAGATLSDRERQVLTLAAEGAGNKQIARELGLSPRTVEAHMRHIFERLGVSSRTEAVTQAIRRHWISLPDDE